jgi:hypothetical protein
MATPDNPEELVWEPGRASHEPNGLYCATYSEDVLLLVSPHQPFKPALVCGYSVVIDQRDEIGVSRGDALVSGPCMSMRPLVLHDPDVVEALANDRSETGVAVDDKDHLVGLGALAGQRFEQSRQALEALFRIGTDNDGDGRPSAQR